MHTFIHCTAESNAAQRYNNKRKCVTVAYPSHNFYGFMWLPIILDVGYSLHALRFFKF
jgi:hypothetical protein